MIFRNDHDWPTASAGDSIGGRCSAAALTGTLTVVCEGWSVTTLTDTVAWVHVVDGRVLCGRPRGKDVFFVPGGKRESGESDLQTLVREIAEELTVTLLPGTVQHAGTYEAPLVDGSAAAVVRMSCYTGEYSGTLAPSSEIDELAWFGYADWPRVPPVDRLLFDDLNAAGELR